MDDVSSSMNQFIIDPVRVHSLTFSFSIQRCGVISAFNKATVQITNNSVYVELWSVDTQNI